jgi:molecular chaperone HtpG
MISDEKFYERMNRVCQLKNVDGEYFTFEEYKAKIENNQTDKDKKLVYLYAQNVENQYPYIQAAKDKSYDVLLMDGILDSHFIQALEQKFTDVRFVRIDSDTIEKLIPKDEVVPSKLNEEECKKVKEMVEMIFDKDKFTIQTESMEQSAQPFTITQNEFMRRMKEMSEMGGGMASFYGEMPEHYNLVVNTNHEIISQVLNEQDSEKRVQILSQLKDLALLQQGLLKGEALDSFIKRSVQIIK